MREWVELFMNLDLLKFHSFGLCIVPFVGALNCWLLSSRKNSWSRDICILCTSKKLAKPTHFQLSRTSIPDYKPEGTRIKAEFTQQCSVLSSYCIMMPGLFFKSLSETSSSGVLCLALRTGTETNKMLGSKNSSVTMQPWGLHKKKVCIHWMLEKFMNQVQIDVVTNCKH